MITTREPQEEMTLSRLSARKIQASEHPFQCHSSEQQNWTIPRDTLSQKRFLRDIQRKTTLENSVTEIYLVIILLTIILVFDIYFRLS